MSDTYCSGGELRPGDSPVKNVGKERTAMTRSLVGDSVTVSTTHREPEVPETQTVSMSVTILITAEPV